MLEVLALLLVLNVIQVAGLKAFLGDNNLVHIPPGHHVPLDGLPLPPDVVAVQVSVEIVHPSDIGQPLIDHEVILIENVFGQLLGVVAQQFRAEGAAVNGQQLMELEGLGVCPGENPILRQRVGIADGAIALAVGVLIIIIGHKQIHAAAFFAGLQGIQEAVEISAHPVITVHNLKIFSLGVFQTLIDALAMAAVGLMNNRKP